MHNVIGICPICTSELEVTRLYCRQCDTTIDGHFALGRFALLSNEQLAFAELFIRSEGKLNRVGQELDLSYPVVRARLTELIEALGFTVEATNALSQQQRRDILAQVAAGEIAAELAVELLRS